MTRDTAVVFANEADPRRVMAVLPKRFAKYGLALHPDKTRLIAFGRTRGLTAGEGGGKPPTFDFLGLTHYWGRSRKGTLVVKRKTARKRLSRALQRVGLWCKRNRHLPVAQRQLHLCSDDNYICASG